MILSLHALTLLLLAFVTTSTVAQCPSGAQFKCCHQSDPGSNPSEITLMQNYGVDTPTNENALVGLGCSDPSTPGQCSSGLIPLCCTTNESEDSFGCVNA
ncbi:hypothetical protein HYDPIDRAFT_35760 [Hydnomerulius pinastri MD-312]|nr:hypothetical protein HYDPIDRAFT_35760 [Hydnomerulius pinastri MD-312]